MESYVIAQHFIFSFLAFSSIAKALGNSEGMSLRNYVLTCSFRSHQVTRKDYRVHTRLPRKMQLWPPSAVAV